MDFSKRFTAVALGALLIAAACGGGTPTTAPSRAPSGGATPSTTAAGPTSEASDEPSEGTSIEFSGGTGDLSGTIVISGSSTVQPISIGVQELFNAQDPNVAISVDGPGTGDGFALFCNGETDISDASRAIGEEEAQACAGAGVEYVEVKVAIDGLSVITSTQNDQVECLTFADIYGLMGPESTGITNWNDAEPLAQELGSTTDLPDAPLTTRIGPGEESGTYDSFVELVIEGFTEDRGQEAVTRPDYQASANDNVIIDGVAGTLDDTTTFGWVGFAFVEENLDRVKPLQVDGGDGCVEPTPETIANGDYPIARDLYIYVNKAKADENAALAAFVDFYVADGTIDQVLETVPYVALDDATFAESQAAWEGR